MPRALDVYVFGTTRTHLKSPLSGLGGIPNNSPQIGGGVDPLNLGSRTRSTQGAVHWLIHPASCELVKCKLSLAVLRSGTFFVF